MRKIPFDFYSCLLAIPLINSFNNSVNLSSICQLILVWFGKKWNGNWLFGIHNFHLLLSLFHRILLEAFRILLMGTWNHFLFILFLFGLVIIRLREDYRHFSFHSRAAKNYKIKRKENKIHIRKKLLTGTKRLISMNRKWKRN